MLTQERLKELVTYDLETGEFRWRDDLETRAGPRMNGKRAGSVDWAGYAKIKLDGDLYYSHRLAWLYVYGEWPELGIDHIDRDRANNAIANLRQATPAQNSARKKTTRVIAPSRGVVPHGAGFVARIHHMGVRYYLGYFSTLAAAKAAYEAKAKEIHGDFAFSDGTQDNPYASASYMGLGFSGMN